MRIRLILRRSIVDTTGAWDGNYSWKVVPLELPDFEEKILAHDLTYDGWVIAGSDVQ